MLKLTDYVMLFAPVGVFGAVAAAITTQGIGVLATYGKFIGTFYLEPGHAVGRADRARVPLPGRPGVHAACSWCANR